MLVYPYHLRHQMILIGIFADNYQYYGNAYLTEGVYDVVDGLDIMSGFFQSFKNITDDIGNSGAAINITAMKAIENSYCPANTVDDLFVNLASFSLNLRSISETAGNLVNSFPDAIDSASEALTGQFIANKDLGFFMFWAFIMVNLVLLLIAAILKSEHMLRAMIIVAQIIVFFMTILCFIEMLIVVWRI